ncbi:hypothetical protein PRIPAC_91118 [Pristionchus pacificus]|uniref:Uncharacterized protein n=1 Tax=Pristionchus pacificus TaxID=54126 RepID=A0A2A6CUW5_PRIPA|nr:hypothetical protein PRIPAC_91118 [Pristionchus pacificus]|eukprot:PDM82022.1 hypothetical protein PRIPAC_36415 [Pristionchus pacificus]
MDERRSGSKTREANDIFPARNPPSRRFSSQRLCGRRLIEALSLCDHKYHRPTRDQLNTVRSRSSGIATKCCRNRCPDEELSRRVGLGDALTMLAKKPKMSVLDNSNLDWK